LVHRRDVGSAGALPGVNSVVVTVVDQALTARVIDRPGF